MFCDSCGTRLEGPANFCPTCGRSFGARITPAVRQNRVARHVRTLGILWLVYAAVHLIPGLFVSSFLGNRSWGLFDGAPPFVPFLMRGVGGVLIAVAVAGALAGWGLMERRAWARMLAIVLGVLGLFNLPFGTALGIYTLWVLAPATSEAEWQAISRPA